MPRRPLVLARILLVVSFSLVALLLGWPAYAAPSGALYLPLVLRPPAPPPLVGRIVFTRDEGSLQRLYVMNADGSSQHTLPHYGNTPAWSPDGQRIAFAQYYGSMGITIINADGSGYRDLTRYT